MALNKLQRLICHKTKPNILIFDCLISWGFQNRILHLRKQEIAEENHVNLEPEGKTCWRFEHYIMTNESRRFGERFGEQPTNNQVSWKGVQAFLWVITSLQGSKKQGSKYVSHVVSMIAARVFWLSVSVFHLKPFRPFRGYKQETYFS